MTQMYEVVVTAIGEVRDADGNLVSAEPVEARMTVTADQAEALGYDTKGVPA
jgi:hypothetical protein